ncbi:hypothetical protein [Marinirhabdus gelatinilytica]|uniref:Uncharacterized protein n=1 Tax=Marinirhabdus gelatinilytica TaxID=1703343 RepID=A0A370QL98_9FLAO|nr:hypothetical protein [Marinirhabdus gelatinilytica]RDK89091.1 hypothetical protein C8D94_101971 [Marinirhabdus gelatinilytica]
MRNFKPFLILIFLLSTTYGVAQEKYTEASVTNALKENFVVFVENVRPAYTKGDNYAEFKRGVLVGTSKPPNYTLPPIPIEGENLLKEAYRVLVANYSPNQIMQGSNFKLVGKAVLYINDQTQKKSVADAEAALFGGNDYLLNNNVILNSSRGECKWWELWCHLNQVFGSGGGAQILQTIVTIIINIL